MQTAAWILGKLCSRFPNPRILLFENEVKMEQLTREGCFPSPSAPHAVHLFKLQYEFICPTSLILRTFNLRGCNLAP